MVHGRGVTAGAGGLALLLVLVLVFVLMGLLGLWWTAPEVDTSHAGGGRPLPTSAGPAGAAPPAATRPAPPLVSLPVPHHPAQTAAAAGAVPLTVAIARKLLVGETGDLVIGLAANASVSEIIFTVQFDANVLQARAGAEGDWAAVAGVHTQFVADISGAEDRVRIRSAAPGLRLAGPGGSVASVQFQAVAPGSTSVLISEVTVKDADGNFVPFVLASSHLQVMVESLPPLMVPAPQTKSAAD